MLVQLEVQITSDISILDQTDLSDLGIMKVMMKTNFFFPD